jgi:hypothetical protein
MSVASSSFALSLYGSRVCISVPCWSIQNCDRTARKTNPRLITGCFDNPSSSCSKRVHLYCHQYNISYMIFFFIIAILVLYHWSLLYIMMPWVLPTHFPYPNQMKKNMCHLRVDIFLAWSFELTETVLSTAIAASPPSAPVPPPLPPLPLFQIFHNLTRETLHWALPLTI